MAEKKAGKTTKQPKATLKQGRSGGDGGIEGVHAKQATTHKNDGTDALFDAVLQLRDADEMRRFFADLCTRQEIAALTERWIIARMLDDGGASYRDISAATGASTTTIGRVAKFLQQEDHGGYRLVLDRLRKRAPRDAGQHPKPNTGKRLR